MSDYLDVILPGIESGEIKLPTMTGGTCMTALFLNALRQSPSDLAEFARSGDQSFLSLSADPQMIQAARECVQIHPGLGVVLESLGAAVGGTFRPKRSRAI